MFIEDEREMRRRAELIEQHYTSETPRNNPGKIIKTTVTVVPAAPDWRVVCEYRDYSTGERDTEIANIVAWQYVSTVRRGRFWCDGDHAETVGKPMIVQNGSVVTVHEAMLEWGEDGKGWQCRCILEPGETWPLKEDQDDAKTDESAAVEPRPL